jgi:DNA-binding MarR family transcriptional regulator
MTAFEKRLARASARYREVPRIGLVRRGAQAGPAAAPAVLEDPGRRAVSLWLRLLAAHNLVLREVRRGMGGEATLPQFDVLAQLEREPAGLTLSVLSHRLLVTAGNLTGIVARLERGGLVHRDGDPLDRRAIRVRLSARGRALLGDLMPKHAALVRSLFAELSAPEQDELRARLARLGDAVVLQAARARASRRRKERTHA